MAEIYSRPIEIYTYNTAPHRIYCKHIKKEPIRLSYHFQSHYNALVPDNFLDFTLQPAPPASSSSSSHSSSSSIPSFRGIVVPGQAEDMKIARVKRLGTHRPEEGGAPGGNEQSAPHQLELETLRSALAASRQEFTKSDRAEFDAAVEESLQAMAERHKRSMDQALGQSELEFQERQMVEQAISISSQQQQQQQQQQALVPAAMVGLGGGVGSMQAGMTQEDLILQQALAASMMGSPCLGNTKSEEQKAAEKESSSSSAALPLPVAAPSNPPPSDGLNDAVRACMDYGFPPDRCIEAYSACARSQGQQTHQALVESMLAYIVASQSDF